MATPTITAMTSTTLATAIAPPGLMRRTMTSLAALAGSRSDVPVRRVSVDTPSP
jgi:hypothetical protein